MNPSLLSGNESVARGAWEAGAVLGVGYPGTPSTETLERFAKFDGVKAEWAPNEKVALEVAAGASMAGIRVLVAMKHVGVNVAADPLFTLAYTGVNGGLVILVADDPGMHSSQNEQDSRNWGPFAHIPVLEPSDSTEALEFTRQAFEISERFDIPVIVRSTTRISHSKGLVTVGERVVPEPRVFESDVAKWVMMPGNARVRRVSLDSRIVELERFAEQTDLNRIEERSKDLGIITSGVSYAYVREALPEASVLKLGLSYPLPAQKIRQFCSGVTRIAVVEEADRYLRTQIRALGVELDDVPLPPAGELSQGAVAAAFGEPAPEMRKSIEGLPARPPIMCPGCPHRGLYYALRSANAVVTGDIGCYTLGALPPLEQMDACVCMGASIPMMHGMNLAGLTDDRPVVSVIGDSTFAHSGMTGLAHMAYNNGTGVVIILDNRITAMTGHQGNPLMGKTLMGEDSVELDVEMLCHSMGIRHVRTVDPHDISATRSALREEISRGELSVVISKAPCALLLPPTEDLFAVNADSCTACGACIKLGCPAIHLTADGRAEIDITVCVGCEQCVRVCKFDAIEPAGPACDVGGGV